MMADAIITGIGTSIVVFTTLLTINELLQISMLKVRAHPVPCNQKHKCAINCSELAGFLSLGVPLSGL
jgi:hypothetical protein